ncbi:hypothetical protein RsS93_04280 [Rhizobium dioscoreae]|uniref:Uncharacterized protein n=1 Tax=Rhizobium dioscoreae TaxID=2653122 RepID=A0ABQ0YXR0_9HYPH|nr:hypothetical protein RsS93_04280 [Rhizobium dioscoreae]
MGSRSIHLRPDLLNLAYDIVSRQRHARRRGRLGSDCRCLFWLGLVAMPLRLFMINRLRSRLLVNFGMVFDAGMFSGRSIGLLFVMRFPPFLCRLVLMRMIRLGRCGRLLIGMLPVLGLRDAGFFRGVRLGGSRRRLFRMYFLGRMVVLSGLRSGLFVRHGRFGNRRLLAARQGLCMFGLDLDNRCLKLVELAAQHFLGRARLHALELPLHGTTSSIVNLDPHLGSIVRQAVNGPSNNCYKIRHQYFLMMPGVQPGRDSS